MNVDFINCSSIFYQKVEKNKVFPCSWNSIVFRSLGTSCTSPVRPPARVKNLDHPCCLVNHQRTHQTRHILKFRSRPDYLMTFLKAHRAGHFISWTFGLVKRLWKINVDSLCWNSIGNFCSFLIEKSITGQQTPCLFSTIVFLSPLLFYISFSSLAVQDSSIGDLVTESVRDFWKKRD